MPSWLITGASRGIGLATVQNLIKKESNFVIAATRSESAALNDLAAQNKNLKVIILDITVPSTIDAAVETVTPLLPNGLDYLVNNAGKGPQPLVKFEDLDLDIFAEEITFNTVAVLRVSRAFLPLIKKSEKKRLIFITSVLASSPTTFLMVNQFNSYTVSKAALNMLAHKWGASLQYEGVITAAIHPGWTADTELGAGLTPWMTKYVPELPSISTEQAGNNVITISENLTLEKTGAYWNYDGTHLPW